MPPRERETIDNEDYYVLDYSINSEDYYDYYGDFKIPINVDISSLTAKLSILSYDYDYEGPLDDQGIEIMFDSIGVSSGHGIKRQVLKMWFW